MCWADFVVGLVHLGLLEGSQQLHVHARVVCLLLDSCCCDVGWVGVGVLLGWVPFGVGVGMGVGLGRVVIVAELVVGMCYWLRVDFRRTLFRRRLFHA